VEAYLKASEVSVDRVEDLRTHMKEGDTIKAMIISVDRKNRGISLSIKALSKAEDSAAMQKLASDSSSSAGTTNLGALLKAKLSGSKTEA
jgi:small subunit ribosomal protein S1